MSGRELERPTLEGVFPHTGRALLLDRAEIDEDGIVKGYHIVTEEDCDGHFPGLPIYPGHLRLEQIALTLGLAAVGNIPEGHLPYLVKTGEARFPGIARAGDEVRTEARLTRPATSRYIIGDGKAFVGEDLVAEVKGIMCLIGPK